MKTKALTGLVLAGILAMTGVAPAGQDTKNPFTGVAAAELPAQAVAAVKAAPAKERQGTVVRVVTEAVSVQPTASPAIVGAISKSFPELAAVAAATATRQHPKLAVDIAKAAAGAAPAKAGKIAVEVCRVVPSNYREVINAVAQVAPKASREILTELANAFPELRNGINTMLAGYANNPPSVAAVMDTVQPQVLLAGDAGGGAPAIALGATLYPPYISTSTSGTNVAPSTSGTVPRGGRNYARP